MKYFFSFFFLMIISLNVAIPVVAQMAGGELCELSKGGTDDAEEESKKEKEKEQKEKETLSFAGQPRIKLNAFSLELFRKSLFAKNDLPCSQLYASTPERPPQS